MASVCPGLAPFPTGFCKDWPRRPDIPCPGLAIGPQRRPHCLGLAGTASGTPSVQSGSHPLVTICIMSQGPVLSSLRLRHLPGALGGGWSGLLPPAVPELQMGPLPPRARQRSPAPQGGEGSLSSPLCLWNRPQDTCDVKLSSDLLLWTVLNAFLKGSDFSKTVSCSCLLCWGAQSRVPCYGLPFQSWALATS